MTEPDEALLWARERAKERFSSPVYINICAQIDAGDWDDDLTYSAEAYRAGAAASAERIKALEARVRKLEWVLRGMIAAASDSFPDRSKQHNLEVALEVLKDPDQ